VEYITRRFKNGIMVPSKTFKKVGHTEGKACGKKSSICETQGRRLGCLPDHQALPLPRGKTGKATKALGSLEGKFLSGKKVNYTEKKQLGLFLFLPGHWWLMCGFWWAFYVYFILYVQSTLFAM